MQKEIRHVACASSAVDGDIAKVVIPVSSNLSIESTLTALTKFRGNPLLNVAVIFTDKGSIVEFTFKVKPI